MYPALIAASSVILVGVAIVVAVLVIGGRKPS